MQEDTAHKYLKRARNIVFEGVMLLGVLLVFAMTFLMWRLMYKPLDVEFIKATVEEALRDEQRGMSVKFEDITLHWPNLRGPLLLGLRGSVLYGPKGKPLLSIDEAKIALNKGALVFGRIQPEGLILSDVALKVVRRGPHEFDIGLNNGSAESVVSGEADDEDVITEILDVLLGKSKNSASPIASLRNFEITNARLVIDDRVVGAVWDLPRADFSFAQVSGGLQADLRVEFPVNIDGSTPVFEGQVLRERGGDMNVDAVLERFSPSLIVEKFPDMDAFMHEGSLVHAKVKAQIAEDYTVKQAEVAMLSDEGAIEYDEFSPDPVKFSGLGILVKYDGDTGALSVPMAQVLLKDVKLELGADLNVNPERTKIEGPVRLDIERIAQKDIGPLWPATLKGDNSEKWIVHKMSEGVFNDVYAQGDLVVQKLEDGWTTDIQKLLAGFSFEGMNVDYRAPLMPVTDASGSGTFDLEKQALDVKINSAKIADMVVKSGELHFIDIIKEGEGKADITVQLDAPLKTVLAFVAEEPIEVKPDFDTVNTKGQAVVEVNIQFPTTEDIPKEAVKIGMKGEMRDVLLPDVVKGMALSGGPYDLLVADGKFSVKGKGQLDGHDVDLDYEEFLSAKDKKYSSKVKASMRADQDFREKFGIDLSSFMSGPAWVNLVYTSFGNGNAQAQVSTDLTQSRLAFEPFDYVKEEGAKATATLLAVLKGGELKAVKDLIGEGPEFKLESSQITFSGKGDQTEMSGGNISRFTLGETVGKLEFEIDKTGLVKLAMTGPFLDLRPFLNGDEDKTEVYDGPPMQISAAFDRMRTADKETMQYGKMYVDINREGKFNQLEMDGIAGAGDVYLRYKPDETGKRTFRFEADDAGATLRAFDLFKEMEGGKMVAYGNPIRNVFDRNLIGHAEITDFKVVKTPVLARLLGLMSLPGLIQSLHGEGLNFAKMEADFDWLYRSKGSLLVLKNGTTSGNALGLTFDGTFDNTAQKLNVSGTIIPLSGVNKVIGAIPVLGDIVTGGTGTLIAATYTMKKEAEDKEPDVFVNPLSVLTPGILRRILFEEN